MKKSTFNKLSSAVFLAAVCVVLAVIYLRAADVDEVLDVQFISSTDVATLESKAKTLISGRENTAGIPIPTPTQKMGKTNPFSSP